MTDPTMTPHEIAADFLAELVGIPADTWGTHPHGGALTTWRDELAARPDLVADIATDRAGMLALYTRLAVARTRLAAELAPAGEEAA